MNTDGYKVIFGSGTKLQIKPSKMYQMCAKGFVGNVHFLLGRTEYEEIGRLSEFHHDRTCQVDVLCWTKLISLNRDDNIYVPL